MTHFVEKELYSSVKAYKIFRLFQNKQDSDPATRDWTNDLFNHQDYLYQEKKLSKIQCPVVGIRTNQLVQDLEIVQKPRLVDVDPIKDDPPRASYEPQKPQFYSGLTQRLQPKSIQQLRSDTILTEKLEDVLQQLCDSNKYAIMEPSKEILHQEYAAAQDAICKLMVRQNYKKYRGILLYKLGSEESKQEQDGTLSLEQIKQDVKLASNFHTLNEGFFAHKETLNFVQLHALVPYVEVSPLSEHFNALLVTDKAERLGSIVEQVLWQMSSQKSVYSLSACNFFTSYPLDSMELNRDSKKLNTIIKTAMEESKMEDLSSCTSVVDGLYDFEVKNFSKVLRQIDSHGSTNQMGVMLYFGDTKVQSKDKRDKETRYRAELLKHCILGLATLYHGGNLVIKVYKTYTAFTVGVIFVLYHLFRTVAIVKPYNSSFLSSRYYIVCKGLKQRRPEHHIGYLLQLLYHLEAHGDTELVYCMGLLGLLEEDEYFLTYIKNHTQALTSVYTYLFERAAAQKRTYDEECFKFKCELFKQWNIPVQQKEAKREQRPGASSKGEDSVQAYFSNLPEEQLKTFEKDGKEVLDFFEKEYRANVKREKKTRQERQELKERYKREQEERQRLEHEQAKAAVLERLNQKKQPAKKKEAKVKDEETKDYGATNEPAQAGTEATMSGGKVKIKIYAGYTETSTKKPASDLEQEKEPVRKRDKKAANKVSAQDVRRSREQSDRPASTRVVYAPQKILTYDEIQARIAEAKRKEREKDAEIQLAFDMAGGTAGKYK